MITHRTSGSIDTQVVQNENQVCWFIEQLHRELKQPMGIERCQCRKKRAQRNHFTCCYQAWFLLKVIAKKLGKTLYKRSMIYGVITCATSYEIRILPPINQPKRKS